MSVIPIQSQPKKTMRDAFLEQVLASMDAGEKVFFLTADLGAPVLDKIRERHPQSCINVGIAEQNLINVAVGLGLEGFTVYAYAIAPFITMRCFEQIRVSLAVLSQVRPMNVNLIGVGAGFSYDVSGPTHHCLEDLSIMRTLPNFQVISPADWVTAGKLFRYTADRIGPKYLRFDAKPLTQIYDDVSEANLEAGFIEIRKGHDVCIVSTGFLTHKSVEAVKRLEAQGHKPGLIDLISVKGFDQAKLIKALSPYKKVVTLEEGFIGKGGMDSAIGNLILEHDLKLKFKAMGLRDRYSFDVGSRDSLHVKSGIDIDSILREASA